MNIIHRIVFNSATGHWTVASERVKARTKGGLQKKSVALALACSFGLLALATSTHAAQVTQNSLDFTDPSTGTTSSVIRLSYDPATLVANTGTMYAYSQAWGPTSQANGMYALAIGDQSRASGNFSTAVGSNTLAANESIAVGSNAAAIGTEAVAIGVNATAASDYAIAMGYLASARGSSSLALGQWATTPGTAAIAMGMLASASGDSGVAIGNRAFSSGAESLALGASANATGDYSTALSGQSTALGLGSVAVGQYAQANNDYDVALGMYSKTDAAVATGTMTVAGHTYNLAGNTPKGTVSVGYQGFERTITNVAAGRVDASSTDAINGSQLYATNQAVDDLATVVNNINTGGGTANVKYFHANSSLADSMAIGDNTVAIGPQATSSGTNSVAIGSAAVASADNSVALGAGSTTNAPVKGTAGTTIAGDAYAFAGTSPSGTVSVGSSGQERTVTNVAAGEVSSNSTDAVNGSQLNATNQSVNKLDTRLTKVENTVQNITQINDGKAGMFQTSTDSTVQPSATGANSAAGGSGASASGNGSLAVGNGAQATADNSVALGNGAQATADNSVALGNGSVADRANTVSVGTAGNDRQVTNVADGTQATDAVNVGQLQAAQAGGVRYDVNADGSVNYNSVTMNAGGSATSIHNVAAGTATTDAVNVGQLRDAVNNSQNWAKGYTDQKVNQMGKRAAAGTASAMAMAGLPQAFQPSQTFAAAAISGYGSQASLAVGLSSISKSGRYIVKLSGATNTSGDVGVTIGAGMSLW